MHSHIGKKKVPQILSLSYKRVGEWSDHSWKWLHRIRHALLTRVVNDKRKSTRTLRIEQRVAIHKLLSVVISHIDLKTMTIGYYDKKTGAFIHLGIEYLAKKAGLNQRRGQRALQWLYQAGYIIGHRRTVIDEDTGEYIHKTSIRKVSLSLFLDLGITEIALNRARNRANKKIESFVLNTLKPIKTNSFNKLNDIITSIGKNCSTFHQANHKQLPEIYLARLKKLKQLFPDKTTNELKSMLPPPHTYN